MSFLSPIWLIALVLIPAYGVASRRNGWKMGQPGIGVLVTIVMVILALSRPVIPQKPVEIEESGSDVIVAVDLSFSMRAGDIAPSRLEAAKKLLRDLVRSNRRDRFGVIGFTTSAIVLSPLTKDTELLEHLFSGLDESQIITKGTNVMSALELARKMSHAARPLVILITDGGDENTYAKEADFVRENDLSLSVVMLATSMGSTIPSAEGSTLKDDAGHIVVSSRNDAIKEIVQAGKGSLIEGADSDALEHLIESAHHDDFQGSGKGSRYQELFYYPLVAALVAFLIAFTRFGGGISKQIAPLLALIGISAQASLIDFAELYLAKRNYQEGKFERSAHLYGTVDSPQARYNRANALYKAGKYPEALSAYRSVKSDDAGLKSKLFYNMGNCYIRMQEFQKAKESLLKSLTLRYTKEADQNLRSIADVEDSNLSLNVRKEKNDRFTQEQAPPVGKQKESKQGGGSNMKSDTASSGGGDEGKKVQSDPRLSMSQGKARLSSRQYELINQRSVHETKPW